MYLIATNGESAKMYQIFKTLFDIFNVFDIFGSTHVFAYVPVPLTTKTPRSR